VFGWTSIPSYTTITFATVTFAIATIAFAFTAVPIATRTGQEHVPSKRNRSDGFLSA